MAQYRATIQGQRGQASRLGSKKTGIRAKVNGWNIGVDVDIYFDAKTGQDRISIYRTGGSNARSMPELIADFTNGEK